MSFLSRVLDDPESIKGLSSQQQKDAIPAFIYLCMSKASMAQDAGDLLLRIVKASDFSAEVVVLNQNGAKLNTALSRSNIEPTQLRVIVPKPGGSAHTMKLFVFAFHMFVSEADELDIDVLVDNIDVVMKLADLDMFASSTRMLLDAVKLGSLLFETTYDKGRDLVAKISAVAEARNDVEVLIMTTSLQTLFGAD